MKIPSRGIQTFHGALVAAAMLGCANLASATLGENFASVTVDAASIQATESILTDANFTVYELRTVAGSVIREYVNPSGIVFAVNWHGPVMPDLRRLLGSFFDRYVQHITNNQPTRRHVKLDAADLVVHSSGHMGAFSGHAFLPQSLPPAFLVEQLQ
jgi:hypothetical protein